MHTLSKAPAPIGIGQSTFETTNRGRFRANARSVLFFRRCAAAFPQNNSAGGISSWP
jgi:hypothetical protein